MLNFKFYSIILNIFLNRYYYFREMVFVYIWEYIVKEEFIEKFKVIYGPDGDWVKLFKKGSGYIETHLHQDISNPKRFITVDFWSSKAHRDKFQNQYSKEFNQLDHACQKFTDSEKLIGDFHSIPA